MKPVELEKLPIVGEKPRNEKEEKYLKEMLEYEFMNLEEPGVMHQFPYGDTKNKYIFKFFHGGKYRIPRHVARWMESRQTPIWNWTPDGRGSLHKQMVGQKPRFQMRPIFGG